MDHGNVTSTPKYLKPSAVLSTSSVPILSPSKMLLKSVLVLALTLVPFAQCRHTHHHSQFKEVGADGDLGDDSGNEEDPIYKMQRQIQLLKNELNKLAEFAASIKICEADKEDGAELKSVLSIGSDPNSRDNLITTTASAIRLADYVTALENYQNVGNTSLSEIIPIVYGNNVQSTEKIVKFLEILPDIHETLAGYRILFEVITKSRDLDSLPIIMWKRQVEAESGPYYQTDNNRNNIHRNASANNFRHILAQSIIGVPWSLSVIIENASGNKFALVNGLLTASSDNLTQSSYQWTLIKREDSKVGTSYQIRTSDEKQFVMIELDGGTRRHVFTSVNPMNDERSFWTFVEVPGGEFFQIKNVRFPDSYLIADGHDLYTKERCEGGHCLWKVLKA